MPAIPSLADKTADVAISAPFLIAESFRRYERFTLSLTSVDGVPLQQTREILRVGRVVGVLVIDRAREEIVLIRQFRLAAHLATGKGELVEIVAGHVEAGEDSARAAYRECLEEIGVAPQALYELFSFMPAPGQIEEYATLYLALVDAAEVPTLAGAAHESERTQPIRIGIKAALAALAENQTCNGYLILALQWLALNWPRIDDVLRERDPVAS